MKRKRYSVEIKGFGKRIKELRKAKSLTQTQLSYLCDMELSTLNRIELGKAGTSLSNILAIAHALEVHPKELFDFDIIAT